MNGRSVAGRHGFRARDSHRRLDENSRNNEQIVVVKGTVTQTFALPVLGQSLARLDAWSLQQTCAIHT